MTARRTMTAAVLVLLLALLGPSCGIPEESEPRAVAPERVPDQLQTVPSITPNTIDEVGQTETIFMVTTDADGDVRLVEYPVGIGNPTARNLLLQLLTADANEALPEGIDNFVPDDLSILDSENEADGVVVDDDLVRVRLNDELQQQQGPRLAASIAQIVWTATEVEGVSRVQLTDANDDPIQVSTDAGAKEIVTRADFADLAPE